MDGIIFALDLARKTGWAIGPIKDRQPTQLELSAGHKANQPLSGVKVLAPEGLEPEAYHAKLDDWINDMISVHKPTIMVVEAPLPAHRQTNAKVAILLMGYATIALKCAYQHNMVAFTKNINAVKKHFCGNGYAKKEEMMAAAKLRGWTFEDDNECDALAVLDMARADFAAKELRTRGRTTA